MEGLPLIPGYSFSDPTVQDFKVKQQLICKNGYRILQDADYGTGRRPTALSLTAFAPGLDADPIEYDPSLTYGRVREYAYSQVVPNYVLFSQKCLNFKAFFRQGIFNSPYEHYRIRHVNIIYFLEDDTLLVSEPPVENCGFRQGKLVKRGKIVKDPEGRTFHWKDLNVGIDIPIYGVVYHTVDCDGFTHEFLRSQGVDVGDKEEAPVDPYTQRMLELSKYDKLSGGGNQSRGIVDDSRRRFLEYDGMVLRFDATWNDDPYQIMYYLTDDTIAVKEIHKPNDGKDPVPMLLKRTRVPKNWKDIPSSHPTIYMEVSDPEVVEYYSPKDLKIGETIFIYGRRFLLLDCDAFTRKYYSGMLCAPQPEAIPPMKQPPRRAEPPKPPPHIPFGSPEDTLASCLSFVPKLPKPDVIRQMHNAPKKLRYLATMEAVHPEDEDRDFILDYALADGKITISEIQKPNSGRRAGCFLSSSLVAKPGTDRDNPLYYTPEDFFIGAKINVYNHRFVIKGVDLFVYRYAEANPEKFCPELRDNLRNWLAAQGLLDDDVTQKVLKDVEAIRERGEDPAEEEQTTEQDPVKICESELTKVEKMPTEEELCRERLAQPERVEIPCPCPVPEPPPALERKKLVWADQIDKDCQGHPIISCKPELPECSTRPPRRGCLKLRSNKKNEDQKLEMAQLVYEDAKEAARSLVKKLDEKNQDVPENLVSAITTPR